MRMRYKNREPVKCKRCYEGPGESEREMRGDVKP